MASNNLAKIYFGGSTLGWSVNHKKSLELLDFFYEYGGRGVDTSDFYSEWIPQNEIGVSERIIGLWLSGVNRSQVEIATKLGISRSRLGFSHDNVIAALEDSLQRLNTDYVDSYLAHAEVTPNHSTGFVRAMTFLSNIGKIREVGLSHNSIETTNRLHEMFTRERGRGLDLVQFNFNLIEQGSKEFARELFSKGEIKVFAARPLASGFLSGKYSNSPFRRRLDVGLGLLKHLYSRGPVALTRPYRSSLMADAAKVYLTTENLDFIQKISKVSKRIDMDLSTTVLAWTLRRPYISRVVMSFRTKGQIRRASEWVDVPSSSIAEIDDLLKNFSTSRA